MFSNSLAKVERTEEQRDDIMVWSKRGFKNSGTNVKMFRLDSEKNHKLKITNTMAKTF